MRIKDIPCRLEQLQHGGILRTVHDLKMRTAVCGEDHDGGSYIVLASNDYLGLSHHPDVQEAECRAASSGSGSGGSRLTSGASFELHDLETEIAGFTGQQEALVFNTGYMANTGVLSGLAGEGDVIFSDALNHASIVDGCRFSRAQTVIYPHCDMERLEQLLIHVPCRGQRFLVTDGVFSMDGDIAPLPELIILKTRYHACLIVDDAHATGVIGEGGRGSLSHYHLEDGVDVHIGTLSKALGAQGGYAASEYPVIEYLKNSSRPFIFSTALPPGTASAALCSLQILESRGDFYMDTLRRNTRYMRKRLTEAGLPLIAGETPILPILTGNPEMSVQYAEQCRKQGIWVSAIRPPSVPAGASRIRITVTAVHTVQQLERAADVLIQCWREMGESVQNPRIDLYGIDDRMR